MKAFILSTILLFVISFSSTNTYGQSKDRKAIMEVMEKEIEYWNSGNIEGYVSLYAPVDSVRMIYTQGATYGRDSILAFYKKYWPKERMGQLSFDGIQLERISNDYYFNSGFFHVKLPDGRMVNGRFSGLMRKIKGRWYIYTDHSG
jgi:ketosteroid isomerase-like protein